MDDDRPPPDGFGLIVLLVVIALVLGAWVSGEYVLLTLVRWLL